MQALGSWEELLETLRQRLEEQKARHEGGSKWVGTGGTSPFGSGGYNPEGVRIGNEGKRQRKAVKVWERREYRNFDDSVELGTRNLKLALRRLRKFAREGAADELDLGGTIEATARNAGWLDLKLVPERRNAVKVLLLLDVGGSMDDHIRVCEELFSAARTEFRHLEYYYFHNFLYESLWKDNRRRHAERTPLLELLRRFNPDYRVVIVGDATMSPYEIVQPGGSVEHWNAEAGSVWMQRLDGAFPAHRLAEPGAGGTLGLDAVDPAGARAGRRPHVPADARRPRSRDRRAASPRQRRASGRAAATATAGGCARRTLRGGARRRGLEDAPGAYVEAMLQAIVGFEIEVSVLNGKFKASQNRDAADREGVARGLAAEGSDGGGIRPSAR